jgi:biopolymer transport protein ExbB
MFDSTRLLKRVASGFAAAAALAALTVPAYAWQDGWSYRTRITLTPSQTGATGDIGTLPVLIRLHSGNFSFKDAKPDGSDLRFLAGDDKTPLKFQVEKWDPTGEVGLVWVQAPGLSTSEPTPIYAYYGNKTATPGGDAKGVFSGQALVWHFAEDGAPQDSSGNGVTGETGVARDPNGLIGQAAKLDGQAAIGLPAAFNLATNTTLSMWVKPAATRATATLFSMTGGLTIGLQDGAPYISVGSQRAQASAAAATDSWTHIAAVADGTKITLYVSGQPAGEISGAPAAQSGQAILGQGFAGDIDELEVARTALPAGAITLATNSQGPGARLASFDKPEELKSGGHDYLSILFRALTPDAWAVIALLAIMSLISWVVMVSKGLTLGRIAAANDDFLDAYEKVTVGSSDHDGLADLPQEYARSSSSLAYLYRVGRRELKKRLADEEGRTMGSRYALSAQSIAAIRSALDAAQVREGRRLNRRMVLLTIAISGGPFLGLLGTVIGVMITFAAVAAAGDVNINAIAPGIAAALLATVAGLAVAIPALFGYNYLLSNVEEIADDDRIFVDELEKRIAELFQDRGRSGPLLQAVAK